MAWPTDNITTLNLDVSTDDPSQARAEMYNALLRVKDIIAGRNTTNGIAPLDAGALVPLANIPATLTGKDADTVDGAHAGTAANNVLKLDASALVPLAQIPATLTGKNADMVDGYHAGNTAGAIPINNGTVNATLNADLLDGYHAANAASSIPILGADAKLPFAQTPALKGVLLYPSANISVASGVATYLPFDSESYDTDAAHDNVTNNSRITIPAGVTYARFFASVAWSGTANGMRVATLSLQRGIPYPGFPLVADVSAGAAQSFASPWIAVSAGMWLELYVSQNSGVTESVYGAAAGQTWFAAEFR